MSQRKEKYARELGTRVGTLEDAVEEIRAELKGHQEQIAEYGDELAVYRAAMENRKRREEVELVEKRKHDRREKRREQARRQQRMIYATATVLCAALLFTIMACACSIADPKGTEDKAASAQGNGPAAADPEPMQTIQLVPMPEPPMMAEPPEWFDDYDGEDPLENEKIEEALLLSGYYSTAVPMCYEYQDYMRIYCEKYACPYPLALAVAEQESGFNMETVGYVGEVGIMQLNPGPGGEYHAELERVTGLDPETPSGNIAAGCYLLGKYMKKYGDVEKAAMAYNMGEGGAAAQWAAGNTSTKYSRAVKAGMEYWECTVNAWNGV